MIKSKLLILAGAAFAAQSLLVTAVLGQPLYPAFVRTVSVTTNDNGGFAYHPYGNRQIIQECAAEAGLTNLDGLHLVYDLTADALEVVSGTNNDVVCTPMTFSGGVTLSKTNNQNNQVEERLAFVSLGTNGVVNGTLRATEFTRLGPTNQVTRFVLNGALQFAQPADGTNAPAIYSGSVSAGNRGRDEGMGEGEWHRGR